MQTSSILVGNGVIDINEFVVMMDKKKQSNREAELMESFKMFDKVFQH